MEQELTFGEDCVISLDDIGDLKDYTDQLEQLITNIKSQPAVLPLPSILEIIGADPQDTFYLPAFPQLLRLLVKLEWTNLGCNVEELLKIIKFQFQVIEQCLFSLSFGQELLPILVQKVGSYTKLDYFQNILLALMFKMVDKVIFLEEYEQIAKLWSYFDESKITKQSQCLAAVYLQCCEKYVRSRKMRTELKKVRKDKPILSSQLSVYTRDSSTFELEKKNLMSQSCFGSAILGEVLLMWERKLIECR